MCAGKCSEGLGEKFKDTITGFEGTATGRYTFLYGNTLVELSGVNNDGDPKSHVFDAARLSSVEGDHPFPVDEHDREAQPA